MRVESWVDLVTSVRVQTAQPVPKTTKPPDSTIYCKSSSSSHWNARVYFMRISWKYGITSRNPYFIGEGDGGSVPPCMQQCRKLWWIVLRVWRTIKGTIFRTLWKDCAASSHKKNKEKVRRGYPEYGKPGFHPWVARTQPESLADCSTLRPVVDTVLVVYNVTEIIDQGAVSHVGTRHWRHHGPQRTRGVCKLCCWLVIGWTHCGKLFRSLFLAFFYPSGRSDIG